MTHVSASWVQPAVHCGAALSLAAFWVGIDGYSSSTVEQTGTIAECYAGSASYYSWWETYPTNAIQVFATVSAGDHFSAYVTFTNNSSVTMSITDSTTATTWSQVATPPSGAAESSAEWIAEAPCCSGSSTYPLSNFSHVTFTSAKATISGVTRGIGGFSSDVKITMITPTNKVRALPSALTTSRSFKVTWKHS